MSITIRSDICLTHLVLCVPVHAVVQIQIWYDVLLIGVASFFYDG